METINPNATPNTYMDIIKKEIILDKSIGKETTQILLEDDIIVPDTKPDMSLMLQADANIIIEKTETSVDRINLVGKLNIQILYLARGSDRPVNSISITQPVDDFINMEGITKDTWVNIKADILNIEYNMINDRKINYRAVVDLSITGSVKDYCQAVVDIEGLSKTQQQRLTLNLSKNVSSKNDRFTIKEEISVPAGKPSIVELLGTSLEIRNQDVRIGEGRVQITGDLNVTTLYKGDDDQLLDFMEHDVPFTGTVDVDQATDDMFADANVNILDKYLQVLQNDDGEDRIIEIEITIGVAVRINTKEELEVLEDAYSTTSHLKIEPTTIKYPRFVARNRNQSNIKDIVALPSECPDILQVFRVKGKAHLDDLKIIQDKVVAEGAIETDILYIAKNDEIPLFSYKTDLPYRQIIETLGASPGMDVTMDVNVDGVHFNMLSDNEIELRVTATFGAFVSETMEINLIKDIEFLDLDKAFMDNMASITVYIVQKGDTLWKIAKRYHTSVEEIVELNHLENPDQLSIGQKLIILKKIG